MISTAQRGTRGRVAVVCGDSETGERAGQEGEVLKVGGLEAVDPRAAGIHRLRDPTSYRRRASKNTKCPCGDIIKSVGNDGVGQIFVKIARSDDSEGIQIMLEEHIDVIRGFRL